MLTPQRLAQFETFGFLLLRQAFSPEEVQPQIQGISLKAFGVPGPDLPCLPLEVEKGDVVIFNHYLFHAVYGKQEGRSYIAMKFAAEPATREHYEALRAHKQDASRLHEAFRHSQRPRIRGMVEKLLFWEEEP